MAKKARPTFQKRQKELARQHKQQAKAARRLQAKQRRATAASEHNEVILHTADGPANPKPLPAPNEGASDEEEPRPQPDSRDTDA